MAPTPPRSLLDAMRAEVVLLDGGLSTELDRLGYDVSSALWSARLLRDDTAAITAVHRSFFAAGAHVATTATYQATFEGFATIGIDRPQAEQLLVRSVRLAREAAAETGHECWVAASIGPYGALLADGSEYTGAYADPAWAGRTSGGMTLGELRAFHRPRLEALAAAGADVLACETIPAAVEAEALLAEVEAVGVPAWLSLTTTTDEHGQVRTRLGEPAEVVFALARDVDSVIAVSVNCVDPTHVGQAVRVAAAASGKPVVVYPNSGERWEARRRRWVGTPGLPAPAVAGWIEAGARLVGGCCRIGPAELRAVADAVRANGSV